MPANACGCAECKRPKIFVGWYTTAKEAEAHVFDTAEEANRWSYQRSNTVDGYITGGAFKAPARWTRKAALTHALARAHRVQDAEGRGK